VKTNTRGRISERWWGDAPAAGESRPPGQVWHVPALVEMTAAATGSARYRGPVRGAAVQLRSGLDKGENLARAQGHIEAAADAGAQLVVLPEATMAGFGAPTTDLVALAEELDGPFVRALCSLAASRAVTVVAGMFEVPAPPGHVYNTVVAAGPEGLLGTYRKLHLYDALGERESDRITAGDPAEGGLLVFPVGGFVAGVMNCYDLRFPEMARVLIDRGATLLLAPANWVAGPGKADVFATLARARAIESTAYLLAAAKAAPECAGHSLAVDPAGGVLAELGADEEGLATAELDPGRVADVRRAIPVLEHRRFAVVPR
jgi:predicted amidohydrolase